MADSEFEELDRAVASVLGTPPPQTASTQPVQHDDVKTLELPGLPELSALKETEVQKPAQAPAEQVAPLASPIVTRAPASPTPAVISSPAVLAVPVTPPQPVLPAISPGTKKKPIFKKQPRTTGRVMDIHPIQPAPTLQSVPAAPLKPVVSQPIPPQRQAFEVPLRQAMSAAPAQRLPQSSVSPQVVEPLNTPFLTDAKVDKRPLGAFSDGTPAQSLTNNESRATAGATTTPPAATQSYTSSAPSFGAAIPSPAEDNEPTPPPLQNKQMSEEQAGLPAELRQDVLSIESSMLHSAPDPAPKPVVHDSETVPVPSIVQQYQEKLSTNTKPSGAIFDTETYHRPVFHTEVKISKRRILALTAIALAVVAVIGLVIYFVVLPASV